MLTHTGMLYGSSIAMFELPNTMWMGYAFSVEWWDEAGEFYVEFFETLGM